MSWWHERWLSLVEHDLVPEPTEQRQGKNLAGSASAVALEVASGTVIARIAERVEAVVHVRIDPIEDRERLEMVDEAASQPALAAAFLLGELPAALDQVWAGAGLSLIPGAADITVDCSCDEWVGHCRHQAAALFRLGALIEQDPFVLLGLRGWSRESFATELRRRRDPEAGGADPAPIGVSAAEAFAATAAPLPTAAPIPSRPGRPRQPPVPPSDSGIDQGDLTRLAADAAALALEVLLGNEDPDRTPVLYLGPDADLARRAAAVLSANPGDDGAAGPALADLARRASVEVLDLERGARAWQVGGPDGFALMSAPTRAAADQIEAARRALGDGARRLADGAQLDGVQLRVDARGRWWRLVADDRLGWLLSSGGLPDPREVI